MIINAKKLQLKKLRKINLFSTIYMIFQQQKDWSSILYIPPNVQLNSEELKRLSKQPFKTPFIKTPGRKK